MWIFESVDLKQQISNSNSEQLQQCRQIIGEAVPERPHIIIIIVCIVYFVIVELSLFYIYFFQLWYMLTVIIDTKQVTRALSKKLVILYL